MTVGLDEAGVIDDRRGRRDADGLGGARDVDDDARPDPARPERGAVLVAGPDDDTRPGGQPERLCGIRPQVTDGIGGRGDRAETTDVEPRRGQHPRRPVAGRDVVQQRRRRIRVVEDEFAGQPRDERAAGEEKSGSALEGGGLGITKPQDLWAYMRRVQVQARDVADPDGIDRLAKRAGVRRRAPIEPDDRGVQRLGVAIDRDEAIDLRREPEDTDLRRVDAGTGPEIADDRGKSLAPIERVLLGPTGMGVFDVVRGGRLGDDAAGRVEQDSLQALGAHVTADRVHRACPTLKSSVV